MYKHTDNTINISRANWLNLLPCLNDKKVLKIGSKKTDNVAAIAYSNPKSFTCLGKRVDGIYFSSINYCNNIDDIALEYFDVIVLDEPEYLTSCKSYRSIKNLFLKAFRVLGKDGTLLICLPDNLIISLLYRYWLKKALLQTGFHFTSYFLCDPSAEYPSFIVPYFEHLNFLIKRFTYFNEKPFVIRHKIKFFLKNIIFRATRIYNPFRGLMVVTGKSLYGKTNNMHIEKMIGKSVIAEHSSRSDNSECPMTYMVRGSKQFVFIHNPVNFNLNSIVKIGFKSLNGAGDVKREYDNLFALGECKALFNEKKIVIPEPLSLFSLKEKDLAAQSALKGTAMNWTLMKFMHQNNRNAILNILEDLTHTLIVVHDICTKKITKPTLSLESDYFYNYSGVSFDWREDKFCKSELIQHGDFTGVNIYRDFDVNTWGIIDWEWMAKGYPPLFDLLSLLTSVRFIKEKAIYRNEMETYYISFIHTYFDNNWFSSHLKKFVKIYCDHFQLDKQLIFHNLITYLIFQSNKYKLIYKMQPYQKLYEKMLVYSLKNKNNFVLM